jgi:hypothetical protein
METLYILELEIRKKKIISLFCCGVSTTNMRNKLQVHFQCFFCEAPLLFFFVIQKLSNSQPNAEIACVLQEEELKWYQRYKSKFIFKGDSNTGFANGRHRKKCILLFR